MNLFQAFVLGFVQGFTEFLPISSSGHLVIFQKILGIPAHDLTFDILLHLATLIAVCLYFYKRFLKLNRKILILLIIATIPAALLGFFFESFIETTFYTLGFTGLGLLVTGIILLYSQKIESQGDKLENLSVKKSLFIGLMQAVAIMPGISRSGSTVTASLFSGIEKKDAFYFSFLMSIPVILGASILQFADIKNYQSIITFSNLVGFITAMITGLFALKLLDKLIVSHKFHYFGYYCLTLGILIISYSILS